MSGMPTIQVFLLLASVVVIVAGTRWRLHPFLALVAVACAFGLAAGFSIGFLGKAFGDGFAQALYSPGLVIVAAAFIAGIAGPAAASGHLPAAMRSRWIAAICGLVAGIGASAAAAFALLAPLLRPIAGDPAPARETVAPTLALALALSASHGLVLFSPVLIAAVSILSAGWGRVALFGLPVAIVVAAFGAVLPRWLPTAGAVARPPASGPQLPAKAGGPDLVLIFAVAVLVLLLMLQSIGYIPSEPLGGGPARELILGLGRPLCLFVVGVGIMAAGYWRTSAKRLTDGSWSGRLLANVAGLLLIVGAAGGLQKLCQETGMAELIGERLLGWQVGPPGGLLIAFAVAATIKTLQGSSLVAAITAAGMLQPLLVPLGLDDPSGRALASLAVGAGAMTVSHVNDEYFWLVSVTAGLSPLRGLGTLTLGTLLQGLLAVAALLALGAVASLF
jgi:GntP family gluconate:H+ symporter